MVTMCDTKSMPIGSSQLSETGYKSCLLYYMVTNIAQKVFTFKHGLNIGQSIYRFNICDWIWEMLIVHTSDFAHLRIHKNHREWYTDLKLSGMLKE